MSDQSQAPGEGAARVRRRVDTPDHGPLARDQGAGVRDRLREPLSLSLGQHSTWVSSLIGKASTT
jgi:hypothetical protein